MTFGDFPEELPTPPAAGPEEYDGCLAGGEAFFSDAATTAALVVLVWKYG